MISITEVYRQSKRAGKHKGGLFLRVIHNRKVKTLTILKDCLYPEEWDRRRKMIVFPENNPQREKYLKSTAAKIAKEKEKLLACISRSEEEGDFHFGDALRNYRCHRYNSSMLTVYGERLALGLETSHHDRTARAYRGAVRRLTKFNQGTDIPLDMLNAGLIKNFEQHLKKQGLALNTISFYMRMLRSIYNKAVTDKRVEEREDSPFADVTKAMQKTVKRALSATDMQKILDFDFSLCKNAEQEKSFRFARRLFLFSFYMRGMCFVDVAYLRKQNIQNGVIRYYRKKTGKMIEVKINADVQHIIDSFADETQNSPYVFPIIRSEEPKRAHLQHESALRIQNIRLQQMAEIAEVKKKVTTHVARHSWASIGKQEKLPLSVIGECLGHSSESVTAIYLSSFDETVLEDANDVVVRAIARR